MSSLDELAEAWGAGSFGGFLWIATLGNATEFLDVVELAERQLWALRALAEAGE